MTTKINFEGLALALFFGSKDVPGVLKKYGVEFRNGKTLEDVCKARMKALKNGHGKAEFELSMFEVYIQQVFKAAKAVANLKAALAKVNAE